MNWRLLSPILALAACLLVGCASSNQEKFNEQVRKWVPLGMPAEDAKKVMEKKGFDCAIEKPGNPVNPVGIPCLICDKEAIWLHTWHAVFFLEEDKVVRYGPLTVE